MSTHIDYEDRFPMVRASMGVDADGLDLGGSPGRVAYRRRVAAAFKLTPVDALVAFTRGIYGATIADDVTQSAALLALAEAHIGTQP